jgi:hypothetical protein
VFGAEWHLAGDAADRLSLDRDQLATRIRRHTGLALCDRCVEAEDVAVTGAAHVRSGRPLLVFADAFHLPWLPHAGRAHLEHTLLLAGVSADGRTFATVDAYHTSTPWGEARPVRAALTRDQFKRAVGSRECRVLWLEAGSPALPQDPATRLAANAAAIGAATRDGVLRRYAEHVRRRLDDPVTVAQLSLDCWLAARHREMHARWLAQVSTSQRLSLPAHFAIAFVEEVVEPWRRAREFAYLAQRRCERARPVPSTVADLLATSIEPAEAALAERLAAHLSGAGTLAGRRH